MKTHIIFALFALVLSSCASRRDVASTPNEDRDYDQIQHSRMIDGPGSRMR